MKGNDRNHAVRRHSLLEENVHDPVDRAAGNECAVLTAVLVGVDQEDGIVSGVKQVRLLSVRHVDGKAGIVLLAKLLQLVVQRHFFWNNRSKSALTTCTRMVPRSAITASSTL